MCIVEMRDCAPKSVLEIINGAQKMNTMKWANALVEQGFYGLQIIALWPAEHIKPSPSVMKLI
jgi:hypothetical protein